CLVSLVVLAQQQPDIPDAPSASRPAQPFPTQPPPSSRPPDEPPAQPQPAENTPSDIPRSQPARDDAPPAKAAAPGTLDQPAESNLPTPGDAPAEPPKMPPVKTVPATVKDFQGKLVEGLLPKDFSVYENGVKQQLRFFTSDPFALSAAIVIDLGMPDVNVQKINETYTALAGAFTPYDELSLYTVSARASRVSDFSTANAQLTAKLNQLKTARGANNGPPVTSGPLGPQGPMVNGRPLDPGGPVVTTPPKVARVLNDAILMAAVDLGKSDRSRRKIIFIISDGREYGSTASYKDVLKVLLTNNISVYGVGVGGAAIPVYNKLQRIRIPKMGLGYTDILPRYTSATGGEVFNEYSRQDIEAIYSHALNGARNQYTLGYSTKATPSTAYRQIEVRIARPNLKVYAKDGYYPAAPLRK